LGLLIRESEKKCLVILSGTQNLGILPATASAWVLRFAQDDKPIGMTVADDKMIGIR
jgi:hypothetical protein